MLKISCVVIYNFTVGAVSVICRTLSCYQCHVFVEMREFPGSQYGADLNNFPYGICKYLALERGRKTPGERHLLAFMSCVCRHRL